MKKSGWYDAIYSSQSLLSGWIEAVIKCITEACLIGLDEMGSPCIQVQWGKSILFSLLQGCELPVGRLSHKDMVYVARVLG